MYYRKKIANRDFYSLLASGQKHFKGVTFMETGFSKDKLGSPHALKGVVFDSCEFYADFAKLDLTGVVFEDCKFAGCRFVECNFNNTIMGVRGTSDSSFTRCTFGKFDLSGGTKEGYYHCHFKGSTLKGTINDGFRHCTFEGMGLDGTTWAGGFSADNHARNCTLRDATFIMEGFPFSSLKNVSFAKATFNVEDWGLTLCDRVSFVGAEFKDESYLILNPRSKVSFANAKLGRNFHLLSDSDRLQNFSFSGATGEGAMIEGETIPPQSVHNFS